MFMCVLENCCAAIVLKFNEEAKWANNAFMRPVGKLRNGFGHLGKISIFTFACVICGMKESSFMNEGSFWMGKLR